MVGMVRKIASVVCLVVFSVAVISGIASAADETVYYLKMESGSSTTTIPSSPVGIDANTTFLMNFDDAGSFETDSTGNTTPNFFTGVSLGTGQTGFSGSVVYDGSNQALITVAEPDDEFTFGSGDFTVEFWMKPYSATQSPVLMEKSGTFGMGFSSSGGLFSYFVVNFWVGTTFHQLVSAPMYDNFTVNQWAHIAFVRSGDNYLLLIDGKLMGYKKVSGAIDHTTSSLFIGSQSYPFYGELDNIRISKVARYGLPSGIANEVSGVPNALVYGGAETFVTGDTGQGNALQLNGDNQYLAGYFSDGTSDMEDIAGTDFTIESMFKTSDTTAQFLISKWGDYGSSFYLGLSTNIQPMFIFKIGTTQHNLVSSQNATANVWHHLAVVRSGTTYTMYLDYVQVASLTVAGEIVSFPNIPFYIGGERLGSYDLYLNGLVDEVRISNYDRSAEFNNTAPVANNQSVSTNEDTALSITLTATDANSDPLTYTVVDGPTHGTLTGTAPNLTYTPVADYNGSDSFTFKANDGTVDSNTATVTITVNAVNDAPVANDQSVSTDEDTAVGVTLTATDADNDALTYTVVDGPTHGTLTGTAPNLTYTPAAGYTGTDTFTFKANDGTVDSNTATVTITINDVNHAPVANDQSVTTTEETAVGITLTATDADNDALTYTVVDGPTHGTLTGTAPNLTYTPAAGYTGTDTFTFKANDGTVDSNTATVTITISDVNHAPVANDQSVTTTEETAVGITLTATDADNDALTYTVVDGPTHGTLTGTAPNLTYTPATDYTGSDSFTFRANDGTVDSNTATVTITVNEAGPAGDNAFQIKLQDGTVLMQVNANGNILMGTTTDDTRNKLQVNGHLNTNGVLTLTNGSSPVIGLADAVQLYAEDESGSAELRVRDEAGNITTLSPHNFSLVKPSDPMAWSYYSKNEKVGKVINVDMLKAVKVLESMSGEKLVHVADLETGSEIKDKSDEEVSLKELVKQQQELINNLQGELKALRARVESIEK